MYDWLTDALDDGDSHVVTANRRLARTLNEAYATRRQAAGDIAWRRPVIVPASAWYSLIAERLLPRSDRPARISVQQSRLLWERCLEDDLDDPMLNMAALARQCHETWNRLQDWCVPLEQCYSEANGADQRIFARAASRYHARLQASRWIDDASFRRSLPVWLGEDDADVPARITLAGFDRISPRLRELLGHCAASGSEVREVPAGSGGHCEIRPCPDPDAELRAAGAWAREMLEAEPGQRVAVVVNTLEQRSDRAGRLLREGATPGWQYASAAVHEAVNVSFGRRLAEYPGVAIALLALRWFSRPLNGEDLSLLLRSPLIGHGDPEGRARLELKLRDWPDRGWSCRQLIDALLPVAARVGGEGWLTAFGEQAERLDAAPARQAPRAWAEMFDDTLVALGWPGAGPLNSVDFQLENRWRDLISEFARLELVTGNMSLAEATGRLATMAADTLYQAESESPAIDVLGPLEAAGLEFDCLWIAGMTASDWPPPGRPSPLLAGSLQRKYAMPDASPGDTVTHARRVMDRLLASARTCIVSYPVMVGDAGQMPTELIAGKPSAEAPVDPGWHASTLVGSRELVRAADPVPPVAKGENVSGGARTLALQGHDPFSAFASGRLGIRTIRPFRAGIGADTRGNLIHAALQNLYANKPDRNQIAEWDDEACERRIRRAVSAAFARHERHADKTLRALFQLEKKRTAALLARVVDVDRGRRGFVVDAVEQELKATFGTLELALRCDRVDRLDDDSVLILDYKSSRTKKFLTRGAPNDLQLLVYATAIEEPVAGLGLYRIDSAMVEIDGAGPALGESEDWNETLGEWRQMVRTAAADFVRGDVRLNGHQGNLDARPLNLLSRYTEVARGH